MAREDAAQVRFVGEQDLMRVDAWFDLCRVLRCDVLLEVLVNKLLGLVVDVMLDARVRMRGGLRLDMLVDGQILRLRQRKRESGENVWGRRRPQGGGVIGEISAVQDGVVVYLFADAEQRAKEGRVRERCDVLRRLWGRHVGVGVDARSLTRERGVDDVRRATYASSDDMVIASCAHGR